MGSGRVPLERLHQGQTTRDRREITDPTGQFESPGHSVDRLVGSLDVFATKRQNPRHAATRSFDLDGVLELRQAPFPVQARHEFAADAKLRDRAMNISHDPHGQSVPMPLALAH